MICRIRQNARSEPKFHHMEMLDGVGRSMREWLIIFIIGLDLRALLAGWVVLSNSPISWSVKISMKFWKEKEPDWRMSSPVFSKHCPVSTSSLCRAASVIIKRTSVLTASSEGLIRTTVSKTSLR